MSVSVLIPTLNEKANIEACIRTVLWSDDIVVVDSGSRDGTVELAEKLGARVVDFKWNGEYPKKKNWALEKVDWKHEWVLILDADEHIPEDLAREIQDVAREGRHPGYFINRKFMFMGKWIRHCGYYPSWNLRLLRHDSGRYERLVGGDTGSGDNEVHEHVVLEGEPGYLKHDMLHYAYPDIATWVEKHNRYSSWEARVEVLGESAEGAKIGKELGRRRWLRKLSRRLPFRPALRFLYSYFYRLGILDGKVGFIFCRLIATYEMLSVYKAEELRRTKQL